MVVVSLAVVGSELRGYPDGLAPSFAVFLVIYTANAWARSRRTALVGASSSPPWSSRGSGRRGRGSRETRPPTAATPASTAASIAYLVVFNGIFFVSAVYFGRSSRVSAARLHALERAGVDLRAAQEIVADQAIGEERTRIARELHDVVAHHVAVIGIQAGAARRTLDRPEIASGALAAVESTARTPSTSWSACSACSGPATTSSRRRRADRRPSLSSWPTPVASGSTCASASRDRLDVPDSVGVTVYRVAQEALTNTLKHAAASTAVVSLRYRDRAVELEVSDDGRGRPGHVDRPGDRHDGSGPRPARHARARRPARRRAAGRAPAARGLPRPRRAAGDPLRSRSDEGAAPWRSVGDLEPRPR